MLSIIHIAPENCKDFLAKITVQRTIKILTVIKVVWFTLSREWKGKTVGSWKKSWWDSCCSLMKLCYCSQNVVKTLPTLYSLFCYCRRYGMYIMAKCAQWFPVLLGRYVDGKHNILTHSFKGWWRLSSTRTDNGFGICLKKKVIIPCLMFAYFSSKKKMKAVPKCVLIVF